jgi:Na+/H+ antiporter
MAGNSIHAVEIVFLLLMLFVIVFASLARRLQLPYPIVLVIAGLVLSFIPGIPKVTLNPQIIFLVVLPPLLYAAAWFTSWRDFSHNIVSIVLLAVGLVAFTVFGVAEAAHWSFAPFDRRLGFVLGAVVATTDAIAATSIAKRIGLPQRIVDVLDGESLVNDATGLLALEFAVAMVVQGQTPTVTSSLVRLIYLVAVGIGAGLLIALIVERLERHLDDGPIEISLSIMVPYATYLAAESVRASGVLAVVAAGLYLSRRSTRLFSPDVRLQAYGFWTTFTFVLNGLVFVLIGLQLPFVLAGIREIPFRTLLLYGALFSALLIVLRIIWVYPGAHAAYFIRRHILHQNEARPSPRAIFVLGWTGMRGVIALAAAISLPEYLADGSPFPQRNLIIFLTFSVILVTLVLQGLTLPPLIRALGLAGASGADREEKDARRIILETVLQHLETQLGGHGSRGHQYEAKERPDGGSQPARRARALREAAAELSADLTEAYEDLAMHYRLRLDALTRRGESDEDDPAASHDRAVNLSRQLVRIERDTAIRLRNEGRINDGVLRQLERELDLTEIRLDAKLRR